VASAPPENNEDKMKKIINIFILACILSPFASENKHPQKGLEFTGTLQTDGLIQHVYEKSARDSFFFAGNNLFILNARNKNRSFAAVNASLDVIMLYGEYARALEAYADMLPSGTISQAPALMDLRKLYLSLYLPWADVSIGRQIINFGKGMLFSPIDVFTTINIFELNFRRRGSDALRIQIPFGETAGADLITEIPGIGSNNSSAIKFFANLFDFDFSAIGIYREKKEEYIAGATFKGDLVVGLYGELVEHFMGTFNDRFFEAMAGIDYSIKNRVFLLMEYYYNQREIEGTQMGLHLLQSVERPFFKKHYLLFSTQYRFNELMNISAGIIQNITDNASILTLQYYYNILQNANSIFYVRWYNSNINDIEVPGMYDLEYGIRVEVSF
jgi:hypothetical protein